jgi:hypothetical protein
LSRRTAQVSDSIAICKQVDSCAGPRRPDPGGRLIQCTLEEPSLSSKTTSPGDPILCYLRSAREFGRSAFPRGSYLSGRFADHRDPGRLAGKGWLKLEFDRLIFPDVDIPIAAKVISVRRFRVDEEGKVIGQSQAFRKNRRH